MGQVRALVALRWRMVRVRRVRLGLLGLAALLPLLLAEATFAGQSLPQGTRLFDVLLLAPTAFVVFAALAVVAPLVSGGGNELFPEGQLAAYPVQPRTVFLSGLLLAPLNLAWAVQVVLLTGITAAVAARGAGVLLALATLAAYVGFVTAAGQAVGWLVIGVRQRRAGRLASRALAAVLALTGVLVVTTGSTAAVLDRTPTTRVVVAAVEGSQGRWRPWLVLTAVLLAGTVLSVRAGRACCAWALRHPHRTGRPELAPVTRRAGRRTVLAELVAVDLASVWRSTPLRRGTLVLAVLPGSVALFAHPTWTSLTLLPGLVAAGAGLLFGVNVFCLDGAGALWVATLPHAQRDTVAAKLLVVAQTCLASVLLAMALAVTQVRTLPTTAEAVAVVGSVLGATVLVVATCGRLSVTRPHKADLRGPRDTPAPPSTMAVYSLRLAMGTTWAGLAFAGAGESGSWQAGLAATVVVLALGTRSLLGTFRAWADPVRRAAVVTTVSYG
jgi:hypothetical protein